MTQKESIMVSSIQPNTNNFLNYLYLFDNEQYVRVKDIDSKLLPLSNDISELTDDVVAYLHEDYKLSSLTDMHPEASEVIEREKTTLAGTAASVETNPFQEYKASIDTPLPVIQSSDPSQSPLSIHYFDTLSENSSYNYVIDRGLYLFGFTSIKATKEDNRVIYLKPTAPWPTNKYYSDIANTDADYSYKQSVYFKTEGVYSHLGIAYKGDPNMGKYVQSFFDEYNTSKTNMVKSEYSAAKIGIPLDFKNYTYGKEKSKELGINIKQPKYEKIYNYYDVNYETTVIEMISNMNITDEKTLPSIYDVLYMDTQPSLKVFLKIPKYPTDKITFSSMTYYLDAYEKAYSDYLSGYNQETKTVTLHDLLSTAEDLGVGSYVNTGQNGEPMADQANELQETLDDKSQTTLTGKKEIFKYLAQMGEDSMEQLKKQGVPLWINELKKGIYFSEKSLNIFDQTADKDSVFPFLVKINIPNEAPGPLAHLLSENDMLDDINIYAASNVINPLDHEATVANYYGAAVLQPAPGQNKKINILDEYKLNTFKIFLKQKEEEEEDTGEEEPASSGVGAGLVSSEDETGYQGDDVHAVIAAAEEEEEEEEDFVPGTALEYTGADPVELQKEYNLIEYGVDLHIDDFGQNLKSDVFVYGDKAAETPKNQLQKLFNKLKAINLKKKLKNLIFNKVLGPGEINEGHFSHQETLMYEIAKYKVDQYGDQKYVQSVFLPISGKTDLTYYDTQVIPFQQYHYKIFTHKAIIGSRYNLTSVDQSVAWASTFSAVSIQYEIEPFIQIVRVPYYNVEPVSFQVDKFNYTTVVDDPPLPPDINFVPFRNVDDEILLLLNNTVGEQTTYLRHIFPEEKILADDVAISQGKLPGKKISFKTDDYLGTYQILRLEEPPTDYTDFSAATQVNSLDIASLRYDKNDSAIQAITPNKNYYYIARFIDVHDKFSNPTEVFRVRMTHESGMAPYLNVEVFDIKEYQKQVHQEIFLPFKDMKKYILIKLSDEQSLLFGGLPIPGEEEPEQELIENYDYLSYPAELGSSKIKDSVFGKKFKIRLTSKQTGKKLDINIDVKQPENIIND